MLAHLQHISLNYEKIVSKNQSSDDTILLFLHEALGSIGQWKSFPQLLCDQLGLNGIIYDRQGHGGSSPFTEKRNARYLHDYALKELPAFIEAVVDPDQKILLIGHSDGGSISLLYSFQFPNRIIGLVTMAAHVINEKETIEGIQPAVDAYQLGKLNGLIKYHGDKTESLFFAWANIWRDDSFIDWDISAEVGGTMPGLFIQGNEDQYGTDLQLEIIEKHYSSSQLLLMENCGHHPHLEKTNNVIFTIDQWYHEQFS